VTAASIVGENSIGIPLRPALVPYGDEVIGVFEAPAVRLGGWQRLPSRPSAAGILRYALVEV